jgi:nitronate monooxygenase
MWPNRDVLDLLGIEMPLIQAPMAGASGVAMAAAVCRAGGLGSLPCAMLDAGTLVTQWDDLRRLTDRPANLNFFSHVLPEPDAGRDTAWLECLAPYYAELGLEPPAIAAAASRRPFDPVMCEVVEAVRPEVVSFHFGLPDDGLLDRVKAAGCMVMGSATTVAEATWLEARGCDAVIAQGLEAGAHRGMFLTDDVATQVGTFALVPQIADSVGVPVIAAGGIADGRGIAAAFALGAAAVQIGTAYLFTPESLITDLHRQALLATADIDTAVTNVFSGRPARGIVNRLMREQGPMSTAVAPFPNAANAVTPLKAAAESRGNTDFSALWSGQGAPLCGETGAAELTRALADEAMGVMQTLGRPGQVE